MGQYRIFRVWIWEILLNVIAFGLIVSIVALLRLNHGSPVPDWGGPISFNALLALLSTFLRATLVITVSQIISQRKWNWHSGDHKRPISNLQQFDAGSRGILGALSLFPIVWWKDLITLTAILVVVTSFLVGPFVQQANGTMECSFPLRGRGASLPFAHFVPRRGAYENTRGGPKAAFDLTAATFSASMAPNAVENQVVGTCVTGNCTFPVGARRDTQTGNSANHESATSSTVGMCSKCMDISSLIYEGEYELYLRYIPESYGIFLDLHTESKINGTRDLSWLGDLLTPDLRETSRWAYINATFLARNGSHASIAAVCTLYPCIRTYISNITKNRLFESEVRSVPMQIHIPEKARAPAFTASALNTLDNQDYDYVAIDPLCLEKNGHTSGPLRNPASHSGETNLALYNLTDYGGPSPYSYTHKNVTASEKCIYRQRAPFVMVLSRNLHTIFNGACDDHGIRYCLSGVVAEVVQNSLGYFRGDGTFDGIARWFDSFATSMTNRFRFQYGAAAFNSPNPGMPDWSYFDADSTSGALPPGEVQGIAWQTTVCVSVRLEWLMLPVCLTIITTSLSVWTIVICWRHRHTRPVWKDSILPLIFYHHFIDPQRAESPQNQSSDNTVEGGGEAESNRLAPMEIMEESELLALGNTILAGIKWPEVEETPLGDITELAPAVLLRQLRQRARRNQSMDSLLESSES